MEGETRNDAVPEGDEELPFPFSFHILNNKQNVPIKCGFHSGTNRFVSFCQHLLTTEGIHFMRLCGNIQAAANLMPLFYCRGKLMTRRILTQLKQFQL
jgi:hypothetical protein